MSMDRLEAFGVFLHAVRQVWSNHEFVTPSLMLANDPPSGKVLASVTYFGKPMAIGNSLIRRAERYILKVSDRLLSMSNEDIMKVLVHEAVHLGYPGHGRDFRELCRKNGGSVSEEAIGSPGVHLQVKVGARYQTVQTFQSEPEAMRFVRAMPKEPGKRYRLSLGSL